MHNLYPSGTFSSMSYLSLTRSVPTGVDEVRFVKVSLIDRDDTPWIRAFTLKSYSISTSLLTFTLPTVYSKVITIQSIFVQNLEILVSIVSQMYFSNFDSTSTIIDIR